MASYILKTFADIYTAVREELKIQSTDTTSLNRIKRDINIIYRELVEEHEWAWLNASVDLQHDSYVHSGTAAVTQNSNVVTLTIAPASSKAGFKFSVDGFEEIYTIDSHVAGALTLYLDGSYTGTTNATATYKIWTDALPLPSDCKEAQLIHQNYNNQPMEGMGLHEFRRITSASPKYEGKPRYFHVYTHTDPNEATSSSIPSVATRSSSGITKTLKFSSGVPASVVAGSRLKIVRPGDPSYSGEITVGSVSTTSVTNDTISYTGRSPLDESATADTGMSVTLIGSESNNTRYRRLLVHPSLSDSRVTLHVDYIKEVIDLVDDSDEPALPLDDRSVLLYGALARAWMRERNPEASDKNQLLFDRKVAKMAGKFREGLDKPKLTPSRLYLSAKRSQARGNLSNGGSFGEGFGAGGSASNPTGSANAVAVYDNQGYLSSSGTVSSTELSYLDGVTSNIQDQIDNLAITYTGDVSTAGSVMTVLTVGGSTAADIHTAEIAANAATDSNTASTIVERDASGDFSAGTITADLVGDVTGNVTGNVSGDVTGNLTGNVTGDVTGNLTGNVTGGVTGNLTGNVTGDVTGNLTGNVTGNVSGTAATFTGNLTGDVTSTGMATTIGAGKVTNSMLAGSIAASKLVGSDIATVGTITSGTWNGTTIAIANGGTGQTSKTNAFDALSPTTTKGDVIVYDGTDNVRVAVGSNGQVLTADSTQASGVKWSAGGGQGGLNLLTLDSSYQATLPDNATAETSVGDWTQYADAAATTPVDMTGGSPGSTAPARSTSSPLNGAASIVWDLGSGSSRQGEGMVSGTVYVPPGYRGRTLVFKGVFEATGALVDGDIVPYAYAISTTAGLITPYTYAKIIGSKGAFGAQVDIPTDCTQLRIGFHVARTATTALSLKFDDLKLTDEQSARGLAGSNWTAYSPTYSGLGTVTPDFAQWMRVGDSLFLQAKWTNGTTAASTAAISLPSGLSVASTKTAASGYTAVGKWEMNRAVAGANKQGTIIVTAGATAVNFGKDDYTDSKVPLTAYNGADILVDSQVMSVFAGPIPIAGWDANVTMAESSTFKISSYLANGTRVTTTPTKLGEYRTEIGSASSQSGTDNAPSTGPSATDGMRIYGKNYTSAGTSGQPNRWSMFIGKNKTYRVEGYENTGRAGSLNINQTSNGASGSVERGLGIAYDPTTGVLTVDALIANFSSSTRAVGVTIPAASDVTSGYFDVIVSENALAVGMELTQPLWQGYTDYSSSVTSASFADFSSATNTTTQVQNQAFGTVSALANLPGITFTPTKSGLYRVTANAYIQTGTTADTSYTFQLYDATGASSIAEGGVRTGGGGARVEATVPLDGFLNVTQPGSTYTLKIRGKAGSGSVSIYDGGSRGAVQWTIVGPR